MTDTHPQKSAFTYRKITFKDTQVKEEAPRARFDDVLRQRVNAYFEANGLSKNASPLMIFKSLFYVSLYVLMFCAVLYFGQQLHTLNSIATNCAFFLSWALLGLSTSGIGFNIGHDSVHGAYGMNSRINYWMSYFFDFVGANASTWKISHNVVHHTFTNIIDMDGDLDSVSALRFCVKPGRKWYHRYQYIYAFALYCFTTFVWVTKKDFSQLFSERMYFYTKKKPKFADIFRLVLFKAIHYSLLIGVPIFAFDIAPWKVIAGFLLMHAASGLSLAIVFQLAHNVEGPKIMDAPSGTTIEDSWMPHQLKTTANFAVGSPLATWLCGGLNHQIEHHLFPHICHIHYPALAPIVKKTALEFGLPYYEHKTFLKALASHVRMLKYFGTTDPDAVTHSGYSRIEGHS